jgi:hypothetical protein
MTSTVDLLPDPAATHTGELASCRVGTARRHLDIRTGRTTQRAPGPRQAAVTEHHEELQRNATNGHQQPRRTRAAP